MHLEEDARYRSFRAAYEEQGDRLYAYLRYRLRDITLAEDMTAEVFARAWPRWDPTRSTATTSAWLFAIARNLVVDSYRQRGRAVREVPLDHMTSADHSDIATLEQHILQTERLAQLERAMDTLSERERNIVALRFVAGLKNREIAPLLGLSEGNIAKIVYRAIRAVRRYCSGEEQGRDYELASPQCVSEQRR